MTTIAIIGGSGLTQLEGLVITRREVGRTPYGEPSAPMVFGQLQGQEIVFLPRHGPNHTIPPHEVNYRANIWTLFNAGIRHIIAVAAVGGINQDIAKTSGLVIPDQIIDYTYGREHTFSGCYQKVTHIDFTQPYCSELRDIILQGAKKARVDTADHGTYGVTQGPRFETAAEIGRMEKDGVDIVGMTGMPEAGLAKELGICYATISVVANPAAGKVASPISLKEIETQLEQGMVKVRKVLEQAILLLT